MRALRREKAWFGGYPRDPCGNIPLLRRRANAESARLLYAGSGRVDLLEANACDMVRLQERGRPTIDIFV